MNFTAAALFAGLILAVAVALGGLIAEHRSPLVGVVAGLVAVLAALGAWYSWAESRSIPWTVGYGVVALTALASSIKQFMGRNNQ